MKLTLDPGAAALLDALHTAGYAAYAVGGCAGDAPEIREHRSNRKADQGDDAVHAGIGFHFFSLPYFLSDRCSRSLFFS